MNKYTDEINENKLKQTLISLSLINDMPVPQRLHEIKIMIEDKKWEDKNFLVKIKNEISTLWNENKIELKHIKTVKEFPKAGRPDSFKFRFYHEFASIEQQIAIAYIIHSKDFLVDINKDFEENIASLIKKHDLEPATNNFGNISFVPKQHECRDNDDDIFYPFYYDWQEKWSAFVGEFDSARTIIDEDDQLLVLKIDFKKSYDNLNPQKIKGWKDENGFPAVGLSMYTLYEISQKYNCEECNVEENDVTQKIPYGGNVESHMVANLLILMKLDKIITSIKDKGFKTIKYIRYADDIAIFIKPHKQNEKASNTFIRIKEKIENSSKETMKAKFMEVNLSEVIEPKIIKEVNINEKKTEWYFVNKKTADKDIIQLKDSYTSLSSIHSLRMPEFLSDNYFDLDTNQDDTLSSRTQRQLKVLKERELINKWSFLPTNLNQTYINKWKLEKNFMSYFIPIYQKSESIEHKKKMINYLLDNTLFFRQENLDVFDHSPQKRFNKAWYQNIKGWFMKFDLSSDIELIKSTIIEDKHKDYYGFKDENIYNSSQIKENPIYKYIEFQGTQRSDFKLFAHSQLVKLIKWIKEKKGCEYKKINNESVFNHLLIMDKQTELKKLPNYWKSLKVNILIYFKEMYGSYPDFLYWRFKHYLVSSDSRIDFMKNCSYLFSTLDKLADLNSLTLNEVDIEYFGIIRSNYLTYTTVKMDNIEQSKKLKNKEVDLLWQIRMLCKILWKNGSFSTQTYTSHNEEHGDVLMLRFVELRRSIKEARHFMHKHNFSIFAVIGSMYTHDLGMLFNGDVEAFYEGDIKKIYDLISDKVRRCHGRNSASIINEWLGSYLNIDSKHTVELSNAAIGHEIGVENLAPQNKKSMNNALIVSILDLLDITYERSNLLSRKLSGTIASDTTIVHWLKHYCTKSISSYKYEKNKFSINIKANRILFDNNKDAKEHLEPIIKDELLKWMKGNVNQLLKINNAQVKDIEIEIIVKWNDEFPKNENLSFYRETKLMSKEQLINLIKNHVRNNEPKN